MITQERLRKLLNYDAETGVFVWLKREDNSPHNRMWNAKNASKIAGRINNGYREIWIDGRPYKAHRLAWLCVRGTWPRDCIDHINGDRADNRIANLREATRSQNQHNRGKQRGNTSGHKGVVWDKHRRKWHAQISASRRRLFLGRFDCLADASAAYEAAAERLHGEFSRIE